MSQTKQVVVGIAVSILVLMMIGCGINVIFKQSFEWHGTNFHETARQLNKLNSYSVKDEAAK